MDQGLNLLGETEQVVQVSDEDEAEEVQGAVSLDATELYRVLFNASLFTAKDEARPILQCVRIVFGQDGDEWRISAASTDSYRLATDSARVEGTPPEHQWLVALHSERGKYLLKRLKGLNKMRSPVEIDPQPDTISFHVPDFSGNGGYTPEVISLANQPGDFPPIERLFPKVGGCVEHVNLSPVFLADYAKVIGLGGYGIRFEYAKEAGDDIASHHKPVLVTLDSSTFKSVLMPIRVKE